MRRPLLLLLCSAPACVAYFDIQLLSEIAKYKVDKDAELRTVRLGRRRLEQSRRQLDESSTTEQASESVSGGTFWDRLSEEGKSPGKRAAITTIIAVAVVIVVCLCCWCAPICDIACWGRARDDNALRETYLPTDKMPPLQNLHIGGGGDDDMPIAAGDEVRARRPLSVDI